MIEGLNLHAVVRGAVNALHPDTPATLYRSTGKFADGERGDPVQVFDEGIDVSIQLQSLGSDVIQRVEDISQAATLRKMYLFADTGAWGMYRPLSRTGDYVKDESGRLWLVNAVLEDFTRSGWVALQVQLQTTGRDIYIQDAGAEEVRKCRI